MIVITIPNWRKKLIILACIILLAAAFSIGLNYYKNINTVIEFEEMFDNPIDTDAQTTQGEEKAAVEGAQEEAVQIPENEAEVVEHDNDNGICENENKDQKAPDKGNLEQEFEEKEAKKGFWQKVLEKFRKE